MVDFLHHRRIHPYVHTKYAFLEEKIIQVFISMLPFDLETF